VNDPSPHVNTLIPNRHTVIAGTDTETYRSLLQTPATRAERYALGKALRQKVPRRSLAGWSPPPARPDPVDLINASHQGRIERLIPIRVGRMAASPYGFLRGAAVVMAYDAAQLPMTGIMPVVCGDAHLGNFGFYASPERELVIDLNDFDEAHPGAWEWDVRRLVASIWVAGRESSASESACADAVLACVASYRQELSRLADLPLFGRAFNRLDVDRLAAETAGPLQRLVTRSAKRARRRTGDRALPRFTREVAGTRTIVEEPPLITRLPPREEGLLAQGLDDYLETLPPNWRRLIGGYTLMDVAHKVVGVGSVGLRAYVALLEGSSTEDVIFLQLKQARRSVLARHVHGDSPWHTHQGQRVVEYQQGLQTVSDPLLGWTTVDGLQFYVRQLRNMKGRIPLEDLSSNTLDDYASVVGQLLAKGHARTSGASMIAGYIGRSDRVGEALCGFARRYADQTEADHAVLLSAVTRGALPVEYE
jgi:uncharacterized protein (DUF2252 family)